MISSCALPDPPTEGLTRPLPWALQRAKIPFSSRHHAGFWFAWVSISMEEVWHACPDHRAPCSAVGTIGRCTHTALSSVPHGITASFATASLLCQRYWLVSQRLPDCHVKGDESSLSAFLALLTCSVSGRCQSCTGRFHGVCQKYESYAVTGVSKKGQTHRTCAACRHMTLRTGCMKTCD